MPTNSISPGDSHLNVSIRAFPDSTSRRASIDFQGFARRSLGYDEHAISRHSLETFGDPAVVIEDAQWPPAACRNMTALQACEQEHLTNPTIQEWLAGFLHATTSTLYLLDAIPPLEGRHRPSTSR